MAWGKLDVAGGRKEKNMKRSVSEKPCFTARNAVVVLQLKASSR